MDRVTSLHRLRHHARNTAFGVSLLLLGSLPAVAAEFVVTTRQDTNTTQCTADACSLRDAILAANASGQPSTIRLGAGSYFINIAGMNEDDGLFGDFDITGDVTIIGVGNASSIGTSFNGEQIVDVAAGAKLRLEQVSVGVGIRTGRFGDGNAEDTVLEVSHSTLGGSSPNGSSINAMGTVRLVDSTITGNGFSSGSAAIRMEGKRLDIIRSVVRPGYLGVVASMAAGGSFELTDSTISQAGQREMCASLNVGASSIVVTRSQSFGGVPAELEPSCLFGQKVVIRDSSFSTHNSDYRALRVSGTVLINNTTIAGSLKTFGSTTVEHATIGGTTVWAGQGPHAIENGGGTVSVSNSALIGSCTGGGITALGNNVEAPGDTCGLPAASSRVNQTVASLELGALLANGGTTVNYLPSTSSVLNRVFTADGVARCRTTDQRGFLRAAACTIGAVESGATEQVLFRDGFDP